MRLAPLIAALLLCAMPAAAALTSAQLATVDEQPPPGATLPMTARFTDETGQARSLADAIGGRPALLMLADFTCRTLCAPVLAMTTGGLATSGLEPGRDYRLIVIGLDPKDSATDAQQFKQAQVKDAPEVAAATTLLRADESTIRTLTEAIGYRFVYDAANDQFAHPNVVFAATASGRIARVLSGLGLNPKGLRLALIDAGEGRIGSFADRLRLMCYGFDPAQGIYTARIMTWLHWAAVLTVLVLFAAIVSLHRRARGHHS